VIRRFFLPGKVACDTLNYRIRHKIRNFAGNNLGQIGSALSIHYIL